MTGCENIGPEDTFDADYGRLLERVYGKGVTSPTGFFILQPLPLEGVMRRRRAA